MREAEEGHGGPHVATRDREGGRPRGLASAHSLYSSTVLKASSSSSSCVNTTA